MMTNSEAMTTDIEAMTTDMETMLIVKIAVFRGLLQFTIVRFQLFLVEQKKYFLLHKNKQIAPQNSCNQNLSFK